MIIAEESEHTDNSPVKLREPKRNSREPEISVDSITSGSGSDTTFKTETEV